MSTTIPNPVASAARARPDHPAVTLGGWSMTWAEIAAAASRKAAALAARGVAPGDTVALLGRPSPEWIVAFYAVGWLGAVAAPLSPRRTDAELARSLETLAPARVLYEPEALSPGVRALMAARPSDCQAISGEDALPERFWPLEEVRLIVLSSGTTGAPRPIPLTTAQITFSAFGSALRLGHDPGDRWLCCLPLNHVGGLSILLRCALYATTAVAHPRFDAGAVARALDSGQIQLVSLVPTMLSAVLDARPAAPFPPGLRAILLGGGAAPEALLARCRAIGAPVAPTWGMTEAASQLATAPPGAAGPGVGPPVAFARISTEGGVLTIEGPVAPGGRLRTRDRGALDERGWVHVHGRADDVIISGGENIDPLEVEAILVAHPAIAEAAVVARPDPRWGQRPAAWLVPAGADRPDESALIEWCRQRLAGFKIPDAFRWIDALPRTELGKVSRAALREATG
jgi:O-succinylbenzoic acid--CoA ligase